MPLPLFAGLSKAMIALMMQSEAVLLFAGDAMQHKAQLDAAYCGFQKLRGEMQEVRQLFRWDHCLPLPMPQASGS